MFLQIHALAYDIISIPATAVCNFPDTDRPIYIRADTGRSADHAVLKVPKENDFRVQHFHGGRIADAQPAEQLIAEATKYVHQFASKTLYARVDGIVTGGKFALMELELIEPYMYLGNHTERFTRYLNALKRSIAGG